MTAAFEAFLHELHSEGSARADGFTVSNFKAMSGSERVAAIDMLEELAPSDPTAISALGGIPTDQARNALVRVRPSPQIVAAQTAYARALIQQGIQDPDPVELLLSIARNYRNDLFTARDAVDILTPLLTQYNLSRAMEELLELAREESTPAQLRGDVGIAYMHFVGLISGLDDLSPTHFDKLAAIREGRVTDFVEAVSGIGPI